MKADGAWQRQGQGYGVSLSRQALLQLRALRRRYMIPLTSLHEHVCSSIEHAYCGLCFMLATTCHYLL